MLTIDHVREIPLFSTLAVTELERLAQTSADLHLGAGEFAVPEGGDRALYAVLAGKIEVVKLIDGVERTLGWRVPGQIFGEVPIAPAHAFLAGSKPRSVPPTPVVFTDWESTMPALGLGVPAKAHPQEPAQLSVQPLPCPVDAPPPEPAVDGLPGREVFRQPPPGAAAP